MTIVIVGERGGRGVWFIMKMVDWGRGNNQPLCYRAFSLSPQSPENSPVTLHVITRNHSPFTHNKTIQICEQKNSNIFGGWLLEMFFDLVKDYRVFLRPSGPSEIPCSIEVVFKPILLFRSNVILISILMAVIWFFK